MAYSIVMKAIYYNIFGLGHINPTLPIVEELRKKGVKIFYHSSPARKEIIEASGAKFINYGRDDYQASDFNPNKNFVLQTIPAAVGLLPFLRAEFERIQPDFILYDSMAIWGHVIAEIYKIPSFCTVATFALPLSAKRETFQQHDVVIDDVTLKAMEFLKRNYDIDLSLHQTLGAYGKNNIVFTAKELNPEMRETYPEQFFYSGAMIRAASSAFTLNLEEIKNSGKKIVTMTLGTILLNEDPSVLNWYKAVIEALKDSIETILILAVGNEENKKILGAIPDNVHLFSYIPQTDILKYSDLFITHAGMNSVNEALHFGVPMILIPHSKDQFVNAKRVEEMNLGIVVDKNEVTAEKIKQAVEIVKKSHFIQNNSKKMAEHFQNHRGLSGIMEYISERIAL